ncbi:MAG: hypothetical protein Q9208_006402 [Pyrenodesmia sp. 3 TL-2023]
MLGYSDVPILLPPDARSYFGCIEAKYVTAYLEDYVDSHVYNGRSLRSRIYHGEYVEKIDKRGDVWIVSALDSERAERSFTAYKLVVATGLTSVPHVPAIFQRPGAFKGPICHHKHFGEISRTLLKTPECQKVVVFGAGKSATDMVYESVKKGKKVSWIIRKDGEGPALFLTAPGRGSIVLDNGMEIEADVLLCGTGWSSQYAFFSKELTCSLGLPHHPDDDTPADSHLWHALLNVAEQQVLADFPILEHPPPHKKPEVLTTSLRMYNGIAPLNDSSVVFLGRAHLSNAFRTSEAQAIWATAYFDGHVKIPPKEQAQRDVAYMNALSRKRYPSHGGAGDYLFFELLWYTDRLMEEVGLRSHRKGWWADWVEPCLASDFKDAKKEYLEKYRA